MIKDVYFARDFHLLESAQVQFFECQEQIKFYLRILNRRVNRGGMAHAMQSAKLAAKESLWMLLMMNKKV